MIFNTVTMLNYADYRSLFILLKSWHLQSGHYTDSESIPKKFKIIRYIMQVLEVQLTASLLTGIPQQLSPQGMTAALSGVANNSRSYHKSIQ